MGSADDKVAEVLSLSDTDFFLASPETLQPREDKLLGCGFEGVAVNAPKRIDTENRQKLPLVVAASFSGDRDWDIPLRDNCILVAVNLCDGSVQFDQPFVSEKEAVSRGGGAKEPRGPKPPGLPERSVTVFAIDVKQRIEMEWDAGLWSLGLLYYDWPSNAVRVELTGKSEIKYASAKAVKPAPNPLGGGKGGFLKKAPEALPCYVRGSKTPAEPKSGAVFTLQGVAEEKHTALHVHAAFAIDARRPHLPEKDEIHQLADGRQETVAAVVPVTLVMVLKDDPEPIFFHWAVPVYGEVRLKEGQPARGQFALDALAGEDAGKLEPGKYVGYLIVDGRIFGPVPAEIPAAF